MNIQKILSLIEKSITCPVCKRKFTQSEIQIKSIYNNIIILNVECSKNHSPINTFHVIIASNEKQKTEKSFLQKNNLKTIYKQIDNYNGDFKSLWKK